MGERQGWPSQSLLLFPRTTSRSMTFSQAFASTTHSTIAYYQVSGPWLQHHQDSTMHSPTFFLPARIPRLLLPILAICFYITPATWAYPLPNAEGLNAAKRTSDAGSEPTDRDGASKSVLVMICVGGGFALAFLTLVAWSVYRYSKAKLPTYEASVQNMPMPENVREIFEAAEPLPAYDKDAECRRRDCDGNDAAALVRAPTTTAPRTELEGDWSGPPKAKSVDVAIIPVTELQPPPCAA
ncbi:hypothetical protein BC832DRAFT_306692 [Gaertneriomyces semiglobifer]|nr:hypothetical protein BC832DRAFT_306692 [Gaertneriomyces semiglobifer]